jgi:LAS superfamily LD-carboxypeptidase LdcB
MLNPLEVTGRASTHVKEVDALNGVVHRSVVAPLLALREAARADGIDLRVVSSFRGFDHQTAIWNAKFSGQRRLLDHHGYAIDAATLDERSLVDAILIWSALPGASRHHWGTDIDVIDHAAMPEGYVPQLVQHEFSAGGVFSLLGAWLRENLTRFGFFRPYTTFRGGVMPEPWHLSYAPVSVPALNELSLEVLVEAISGSSLLGRESVLARLPELYERYVRTVDDPD